MDKLEWQVILEYLRNQTRLDGAEIGKFEREVPQKIKDAKAYRRSIDRTYKDDVLAVA